MGKNRIRLLLNECRQFMMADQQFAEVIVNLLVRHVSTETCLESYCATYLAVSMRRTLRARRPPTPVVSRCTRHFRYHLERPEADTCRVMIQRLDLATLGHMALLSQFPLRDLRVLSIEIESLVRCQGSVQPGQSIVHALD